MFGYVIANQTDLTADQQQRYKGCYCGLCHVLKERYGNVGRLTLTYDMTFAVLLLSSLYEPDEQQRDERCILHPAKPHFCWYNELTAYAADMNIALAYHAGLDNWQDERKLTGLAESKLLAKAYRSLEDRWPRQCSAIEGSLAALAALERDGNEDLEAASGYFGALMGEVLCPYDDRWTDTLQRVGTNLGKFIYALDAYDDLEADIKRGNYNPLRALSQTADYHQAVEDILTLLMAGCADAFETLPLVQDLGLLRNILYSGVWTRFEQKRTAPQTTDTGDTHER